MTGFGRARVLIYQRRYDEALLELDRARGEDPGHRLVNAMRAEVLSVSGKPEIACEVMQELLRRNPQIDEPDHCLSAVGKHEEARAQLTERVKEVASMDHDIPYRWRLCTRWKVSETKRAGRKKH